MDKKRFVRILKLLPMLVGTVLCVAGLVIYPKETADGIKNGLLLLAENIIPSLFPFMVLSTYISSSPLIDFFAKILEKPAQKIFKTNAVALISVILGLLGGYPIGAKSAAEFYERGKLTENEVRRLLCWCVNPSPAFVITAVGTFMLANTKSGIILYFSCLSATLTIGFCTRFFSDGKSTLKTAESTVDRKNIFVNSVSVGSEAMFSVCGWVLVFSAIAVLSDVFSPNKTVAVLLKSVLEVTTGCGYAVSNGLPLPVICAILGFGGLAVIFQIAPYTEKCNIQIKTFICVKIINGALSSFFCSQFLKIFPQSTAVFTEIHAGGTVFPISHSISATLILLLMCTVLIFEVDNKRKMC